MGSAITSIATAFGELTLGTIELRRRFGDETMNRIESVSGIVERRIAAPQTCSSDLACRAAKLLFDNFDISPKSVDALIFATQTPDYLLPSNACIVQERLKISTSCAAFDINLGCSQFIYAAATARAWIDSNLAKKILVLCADTPSKLINPLDKSSVSIFGDGAAAFIVEKNPRNCLLDFSFGTDGRGFTDLICPTSGLRRRPTKLDSVEKLDANGNVRCDENLFMDGVKIFSFAYRTVPRAIDDLLKKNALGTDDIDLFVFHQAGEKIVSACAKKLGIDMDKVWFKMHDVGNCGGASVPIALADAYTAGRLKKGMKVAVSAFGVGLSWGCALIDWSDDFIGAATDADFSKSPPKPASQKAAD